MPISGIVAFLLGFVGALFFAQVMASQWWSPTTLEALW
jgi:hypothetical protein